MRAQLTLQLSFVICKLPCGCLWRNILLVSIPCGGISLVELVCDLVSSHLAACNLHNLRTESTASSVHDIGSCFFLLQKRFHVFLTQWLAKVTDSMACISCESTVQRSLRCIFCVSWNFEGVDGTVKDNLYILSLLDFRQYLDFLSGI